MNVLDLVYEETVRDINNFDAEQRLMAIGMRKGAQELYERLRASQGNGGASNLTDTAADAEQEAADIQE